MVPRAAPKPSKPICRPGLSRWRAWASDLWPAGRREMDRSAGAGPGAVFLAEHIGLLGLEIARDADDHEFQRRLAGGGEGPGFAQRGGNGIAGVNLRRLAIDGGGAVAAHHIINFR